MPSAQPLVSVAALKDITARLNAAQAHHRIPLSIRFPNLKPFILYTRTTITSIRQAMNRRIARHRSLISLDYRIHKHQSLLLRKLGSTDLRLQRNKIINLQLAIQTIDGIIIQPGEIFSLWSLVGKPTKRKGYVNGMLLSRGEVIEGLGGGLCQLANLLHWIFLHGPLEITERYHHSMDVFPDSGRTIPFGSGATILFNFVDLKARNVSKSPIQIRLWLTDDKLYGDLRTADPKFDGYRVRETDACFVLWRKKWFRYNQLWRVSREKNKKRVSELAVTNLAPVLYKVDEKILRENGVAIVKL